MKNKTRNEHLIDYKLRGGGTVIKMVHKNKWGSNLFECECSCKQKFFCTKYQIIGNINIKPRYGCIDCAYKSIKQFKILGNKFNRLKIISVYSKDHRNQYSYLCKCDCNNLCVIRGDSFKSGKTKSCGCLQKEMLRKQRGSNHPAWIFDKSHQRCSESDRGRLSYLKLNIKTFEKDDYCCIKCKRKFVKEELHAHHLNGFNWYRTGRFELDNMKTLCKICHRKFHNIFGNRYNTKAQFYEFIVMGV